jgi:hypothetical protein
MTTTTTELIDSLVEGATPVRRLRSPVLRALFWIALAGSILALVAVGHGVRPDLARRLQDPLFAISIAGALATGILAAIAAFALSLPDRSRWWGLLPLPGLTVWVATIGYGCLAHWVSFGPEGFHVEGELGCFSILLLTSVPLALVLMVMLRYAALLRPGPVTLCAGLAVAAIAATALSIIHNHDASALALFWNVGTAAVIAGLGSLFGRGMLGFMASHVKSEWQAALSGPVRGRVSP